MADHDDHVDNLDSDVGDLFGDIIDDDDDVGKAGDESRAQHDGARASQQGEYTVQHKNVQPLQLHRHRTPRTEMDGSLRSLKVPAFLKWQPNQYKPDTFEPAEWDFENAKADQPKEVVRWQRDAASGKLKSNALVHQWSDGSYSLTVGGNHYELQTKAMAPPRKQPYQEALDSHYYAAAAHLQSNILVAVGHIVEQFTVLPDRKVQEASRAAFAAKMAEAQLMKERKSSSIFTTTTDPEHERREAEKAEKERAKLERKKQTAAARGFFRSGGGGGGGTGQSAGGHDGPARAGGSTRKRGQPGANRVKKRKPEYDSDDDLPEGRGRGDEYDRNDDFIASSDEEHVSDDGANDDVLDDEPEDDRRPARKRQKKAAESAAAHAGREDAAAGSKARRRHVVDEEEDE